MDVLLDSNIYLQDLTMAGNQFVELFTYLRRTGSKIFLPHLVREEVKGRYSEWIREASRKAQTSHENLWKLSAFERPQFNSPQIPREIQSLLDRMRRPSKGVTVVEVDDYSAVDLKEVVNRAVQRRRPANEKGEELRDVILWLLALHLAKDSRSGIIFISGDKAFKSDDTLNLHPDLTRSHLINALQGVGALAPTFKSRSSRTLAPEERRLLVSDPFMRQALAM